MKTIRIGTLERFILSLGVLSLGLFWGCGVFQQQAVSTPAVAKPEASQVASTAEKVAKELAPAAPAPPSPPPPQPTLPAAPKAMPPAPVPEAKPVPKAEPAVPEIQDPLATGSILLDPSVVQDAKTIQGRLAELGFYKMEIDGIWGKGSLAALRKFKQKNSLGSKDEWDKETQMALFKKAGRAGPPAATPSQDPLASGSVFLDPFHPDDAKTIQGRLLELGFYKMEIDGVWGKGSRAALRAFKEKNGLADPDKWDKETQMLLFKGAGR